MTRSMTVDELVYINEQISSAEPIHTIVNGKRKVRDMGLLEGAAARPLQSAFGQDAFPTLPEKVTALLHAIARNHPFADGNKRTAAVAALFMLEINGQRAVWKPGEALTRILEIAEGKADIESFAAWLPLESCPPAPEPDAERDVILIADIIARHRWLLDELAKQ